MILWDFCAIGIATTLGPCAWMTLRGRAEQRLVGLLMTGMLVTLTLVILTIAFGRPEFIDLALTLSVLSFGSGLVFARFMEKHL